jgi:carboxypeptidase C (cathepsin A)
MFYAFRNRAVNMLFIEAPVGVGFSYSDNKNYKCTDDRTASENLAAVEAFFLKYPELKNNKFFITGESYAGVYVPTLAEAILKATQAGTYTGAQLTGIAVGNGCSGTKVGVCGDGPQVSVAALIGKRCLLVHDLTQRCIAV